MATDFLVLELQAKGFKNVEERLNRLSRTMKKMSSTMKKLKADMLAIGLAFLFTGMAIKAFFTNLAKTAFNTFEAIAGQNNELIERTNRLQAAWEFFKYSLVDALSQSDLFIAIIDAVIQLVAWFNNLSVEAKQKIGLIVIALIVLSTMMMVVGMGVLFLQGIMNSSAIVMVAAVGTVVAMFALMNDETSKAGSEFEAAGLLFIGIGVAVAAMGAPFGIIIALFGVLVFTIGLVIDKQQTWRNLFINTVQMFVMGFSVIGQAIDDYFLDRLTEAILRLRKLIRMFNSVVPDSLKISTKFLDDFEIKLGISRNRVSDLAGDFLAWSDKFRDPVEDVSFFDKIINGIGNIKNDIFKELGISTPEAKTVDALGVSSAYNADGTLKTQAQLDAEITKEKETDVTEIPEFKLNQESLNDMFEVVRDGTKQGNEEAEKIVGSLPAFG